MANNALADFFVSIHRNATVTPNTGSGIETLVFDNTGIKAEMAANVNAELEKLGFYNYGVTERPNLVVLRRTTMPSILIEAGYLDSDADNEKFDAEFDQIANAIATGILNTLETGEAEASIEASAQAQSMPTDVLYRVQVGAFSNMQLAEHLVNQLQDQGFPAFMIYGNGLYKVQVGAFKVLDNAVRMELKLRQSGYNTFITTH